jgi:hypothetical protein
VKRVERPRVVSRHFQILGSEYANPYSSSGFIEPQGLQQKLESNFRRSMEELCKTVPKEKIYLLQILNAYKPTVPFENKEAEGNMEPSFPSLSIQWRELHEAMCRVGESGIRHGRWVLV